MKILTQLESYTDALLDLIYPSNINCIACNSYIKRDGQYGFCSVCLKKISFITDNSCRTCSKPLSPREDIDICTDCKETSHSFERALAVVEYEGVIQKLVFKFKYHGCTYLARHMGMMMVEAMEREEITADRIVAVPLYHQRERERGYNQAHLLAKYIAKSMGMDYNNHYLVRTKNTEVMHNLSKIQRRQNASNAFQVRDSSFIVGKRILLIDDIFTSGATAEACSKVLIEAGAKAVEVMTFARGT